VISKNIFGDEHFLVSSILMRLGIILGNLDNPTHDIEKSKQILGQVSKSSLPKRELILTFLFKALAIREKQFGKDHRNTKEVAHALHAIEHPEEMQEMATEDDEVKQRATREIVSRQVKSAAPPVHVASSYSMDEVQALVIDNGSGMSKVSFFFPSFLRAPPPKTLPGNLIFID